MAMYHYSTRNQLKNNVSYSSLPAGLEIAVAPNRVVPTLKNTSRYTYKPLPPLPHLSGKPSSQFLEQNLSSNTLDIAATRRVSTFPDAKHGRDRRGSIKKIESLLGHKLDRITRQPTREESSKNKNQEITPQLPEVDGLSKPDRHNHVDTLWDIRQYMRSDSEYSLSSTSAYSEDNTVEDIVDIYSRWDSWASNLETPSLSGKRPFYLQPSTYSASATELGCASHVSNARQPSRGSLDGVQKSPKATTLSELITEERQRFEGSCPRDKSPFRGGERTNSFRDRIVSETSTSGYAPWNDDDIHRHVFAPRPLALRSKGYHEPHRSMSRWSDHSSDGGMISNTRDSLMSQIRSTSSAFKVPSRPSLVFKEKAATSTIQVPSLERAARKRAFPSRKHPLKSPFPFRSPPHKKAHSDESLTTKNPRFLSRISGSFKSFSGIGNSPIIKSRIISNHERTGDGPDTPIPTKPGLMGILSPTTILFQKSSLQIQNAMQKAKRAARVKPRDERRRDRLRKKIVVGTAKTSPHIFHWV